MEETIHPLRLHTRRLAHNRDLRCDGQMDVPPIPVTVASMTSLKNVPDLHEVVEAIFITDVHIPARNVANIPYVELDGASMHPFMPGVVVPPGVKLQLPETD